MPFVDLMIFFYLGQKKRQKSFFLLLLIDHSCGFQGFFSSYFPFYFLLSVLFIPLSVSLPVLFSFPSWYCGISHMI